MKVYVTDHAVLRWIERVYKIDLDAIREEVATVVRRFAAPGITNISSGGVTLALVTEGDVVRVKTILPSSSPLAAVIGGLRANGRMPTGKNESRREMHKRRRRERKGSAT